MENVRQLKLGEKVRFIGTVSDVMRRNGKARVKLFNVSVGERKIQHLWIDEIKGKDVDFKQGNVIAGSGEAVLYFRKNSTGDFTLKIKNYYKVK